MAKYIIDIPDDGQCQYRYNEDTKELRFPCPRLDPNSFMGLDITISGATPYTEPDKDESYGYKIIGLAFLNWLESNSRDKPKSSYDVYKFLDKNCCDRDSVEQEVWDLAQKLGDMNQDQWISCFGVDSSLKSPSDYDYQEAKTKYEEWLKQKDEIHEYDEIISEVQDNKAIIVRIDCWGQWHCVNSDGIFVVEINQQGCWRKTGRSFSELGNVLKKMGEGK